MTQSSIFHGLSPDSRGPAERPLRSNERLGAGAGTWKNHRLVSDNEEIFDPALRAANLALSGRKRREVSRIASIELRFTDARSGAWEALAMVSVGVATVLCIVGVWFL
jgi:hypothetical protein